MDGRPAAELTLSLGVDPVARRLVPVDGVVLAGATR